ncbi:hypothetical protein [Treponema sp.]|uniref:hypothetical protein n=1 Tax=Treponema sp. TaxID=166 RepID=UPI00388F39B0
MLRIKISVMCALFFFASVFSFADAGLGGSFSYSASTTPQSFISFTARSDISPWCFFLNAHLNENTVSVFADNWFVNERIAEHLDYYCLWGMSFLAAFEENRLICATGARFGFGLDFFIIKRHIEIFAQTVWNPYFGIKKQDREYSPVIRPVNFPCTAGMRIWF